VGEWDRRFRECNDYALWHGFAGAWPNFHQANYGDGIVYGTHLLLRGVSELRDVPRNEYGNVDAADVPGMFRAANVYATTHGYRAGIPTFHQADSGTGTVYGTHLIHMSTADFRDVAAAELGVFDVADAPAMLRAASVYASQHGYAAGVPTFHQADYGGGPVFGLILFRSDVTTWRDVPADLLAGYSDAPWPVAVVLCHPSDALPGPAAQQRWERMFLPGGDDPSNMPLYWQQISYGQFDPTGTRVFDWLDVGHTRAEFAAFVGLRQRHQAAVWGQAAAIRSGISLAGFKAVVFGYNVDLDHGSSGGNQVVLSFRDDRAFEPTFVAHELGHGFGLGHSSSQIDGTYGDRFDIMSAMNVWAFTDAQRRAAGPGASAINLENLGWLHRSRVWRGWPETPQSLRLSALNRPEGDGFLAARLAASPQFPAVYLEYREPTHWDVALPGPHVLVHTRNLENGPEIFGGGAIPAGALTSGQQLTVPVEPRPVAIRVERIDPNTAVAEVRIWTLDTQPVRYGATIRLGHLNTGMHLHSHPFPYSHPGSSGQQQVTCFAGNDDNDLWRVKAGDGQPGDSLEGEPVRHDDVVRLEHLLTGRNLHSHAGFPSPVTGQQEITCFGDRGRGDRNDNWRVELVAGGQWETGRQVRLVHQLTDVALHSHAGYTDPTSTMGQQEVTGFSGRDGNDLWFAFDTPALDARFDLQTVPDFIELGQPVQVTIEMLNIGSAAWQPGQHRLGSQAPQDNLRWATSRADLSSTAVPGDRVTFVFTITAPAVPGTYTFQWRLLQEGVAWFGPLTPGVKIIVGPPGGPAIVPDVTEMTRTNAARGIASAGLLANFTGTGSWVARQEPRPDTRVPRATTVTCHLTTRRPQ
jgi:hypothetical protein